MAWLHLDLYHQQVHQMFLLQTQPRPILEELPILQSKMMPAMGEHEILITKR
jgi:hypothetical protein